MGKVLAGVFAGVFVAALAVELLNRSKPGWCEKMRSRVKDSMSSAKKAFIEGYRATTA